MRNLKWLVVAVVLAGVTVIVVGSITAVERRHFATHGHFVPYGWHVDVGTVVPDPKFAEPYPDPKGGGIVVPTEGQWAKVQNFTFFPGFVEACMSGKIPVFPLRVEKLDTATGKWMVVPPNQGETCLNLPIQTKVIWPLESFATMPIPIAKASFWFHKGDWVRIVALSKCNKPLEAHREFASPSFQLTEDIAGNSR